MALRGEALADADADGAPEPRRSRWGRNGCDWLAAELQYALGIDADEIAVRMGARRQWVIQRARLDGWRRDPTPADWTRMVTGVARAAAARELVGGAAADQRARSIERLLRLAAPEALAGAGRRGSAGVGKKGSGDAGSRDMRDRHDDDGVDWCAELRRRLEVLVGPLKLDAGPERGGDGVLQEHKCRPPGGAEGVLPVEPVAKTRPDGA
ncbi:hypothetical protein GC169_04810 [bacterium]|nr:hypothetical protein [bacterium]